MSLPITAVGPLNVLTKPILTGFCCATAGSRRERQHGHHGGGAGAGRKG